MSLIDVVTVLVIGAVVGLLPGLFGVGGGFIMIPALHIFAGVPIPLAIGSSTCQMLGSVSTGMFHRARSRRLSIRLAMTMTGGSYVGLWLGLHFLEWAKRQGTWRIDGRTVPKMELVMLSSYLLLLVVLSVVVAAEWWHTRNSLRDAPQGWLSWVRLPPFAEFDEVGGRSLSIPVVAMLGTLVGFLNGGLGMGGAIILVPSLVFLIGVPTHEAVTVSLVLSFINGLGAVAGHGWLENVDLRLACLLLASGTIGAKLGSLIGERISGRRLRGYFSLVVVAGAVIIGRQLYLVLSGG